MNSPAAGVISIDAGHHDDLHARSSRGVPSGNGKERLCGCSWIRIATVSGYIISSTVYGSVEEQRSQPTQFATNSFSHASRYYTSDRLCLQVGLDRKIPGKSREQPEAEGTTKHA